MSAKVLSKKQKLLLEEMGFNTLKIEHKKKREMNFSKKQKKRMKRTYQ